jgi:hypothetical protein
MFSDKDLQTLEGKYATLRIRNIGLAESYVVFPYETESGRVRHPWVFP